LGIWSWPDKVAKMQSPGGQPESNAVMHQHLHAVGASIGKEVGGVRVGMTARLGIMNDRLGRIRV